MGFLRKQSARLMREKWPNAQLLAEELIAIFNSEEPFEIDGPLIINNNTSNPAIRISQFGNSDIAIRINPRPDPPIRLPELPDIYIGDVVIGDSVTNIYNDGDSDTDSPGERVIIGEKSSAFPAKIISGSGNTYKAEIYINGLDSEPIKGTVTQLQIHPGEVIPAGTWALAIRVRGKYYIQVPVWL